MNNYMAQMFIIALTAIAFLYFWDQLCRMKYSFWHIAIRWVFYGDFKPMDWLIDHVYYLGFLLIVVGHGYALYGLLQQLGSVYLEHKPTALFISPVFNQIGLIFSVFFIMKRERVSIKRILKTSR